MRIYFSWLFLKSHKLIIDMNRITKLCVFSLVLFFSMAVVAQTKFVGAENSNIRYEGRVNLANKFAPMMAFPGTRVTACFTGTSIAVQMKPNSGYFMVGVDGKDYRKIHFGERDSVIRIASGLPEGRHIIELMLATEEYQEQAEFYGFIIDDDAELLDMGKDNRHSIEYIGDSMTCGYGTEAADGTVKYDPSNSNFFYTYAANVSRELDLRTTVVARSGIGVYRNYNGNINGDEGAMPHWYDYTLIYDDSQLWNTAGNIPEVLCIALGTNDFSTTGCNVDLFRENYEKFVRHLRSLYPSTKIIMLSGCMLGGESLASQNAALDAIYTTLRGEGDENIYRFDFTQQTGDLGFGADLHPSKAQHRKMANELIPYLCEITGWKLK